MEITKSSTHSPTPPPPPPPPPWLRNPDDLLPSTSSTDQPPPDQGISNYLIKEEKPIKPTNRLQKLAMGPHL